MAKRRRIWLAGGGAHPYCCDGPPNTCHNVRLLEAECSEFHDKRIQEATERINEILDGLREAPPNDTHLVLTDTSVGLLLAWAESIDRPDDLAPFVTADSEEDDIREALGLPPEATAS